MVNTLHRRILKMYIKEVAASLYPWDLADEGVDRCIGNVTEMAGANSLYLIGLMYWEKRPLADMFYPHNPVRKYYIPENSRIYYHVPEKAFDGLKLKPIPTERDFLRKTDWLDLLSQKARERSLTMTLISYRLVFFFLHRQIHHQFGAVIKMNLNVFCRW